MASQRSISFRSNLLSATTDLLRGVELHCARTANLIVGLVSRLAAYTEEGVPLAPAVYICNSIADLVKRCGTGEFIPLSKDEPTEMAATKILKLGAPLCSGGWQIYVERSPDGVTCRFGVFSTTTDLASLNAEEVLLHDFEPGFPIVRLAQRVTNKVEVKTNIDSGIEFRFNDDVDVAELTDTRSLQRLAQIAASDVPGHAEEFAGLLYRILTSAIAQSHGTLIAVVKNEADGIPAPLTDAVKLDPPLNFFEKYRRHIEDEKTTDTMSRLNLASQLLAGFLRSDGITVLSTSGSVLGYRGFIKTEVPDQPASGGARTRAFVALQALVGKELKAAFFRSQDGRSELSESEVA